MSITHAIFLKKVFSPHLVYVIILIFTKTIRTAAMSNIKIFLAWVVAMISMGCCYSQEARVANGDVILKVNQSLTTLQVNLKNREYPNGDTLAKAIHQNLKEANLMLNGLIDKMLSERTKTEAYYQMLNELANYRDLFRLATHTNSLDSIYELSLFVRNDLMLKKTSALGLEEPDPEFVSIRILVFKANSQTPLPGYIAHVKPNWSLDPAQTQNFNATNLAVKSILPGMKFFWIEKDGKFVQSKSDGVRFSIKEVLETFTVK